MSIDYKSYDFQIYEYLIRLQQELQKGICCEKTQNWMHQIEEERDRIRTRRFRVAVVGEFKRGKSSFINALLGKELLPVDVNPTTATINRITYGTTPKAYLCMKDGSKTDVEIEKLADYVTKLTEESSEQAARIREAVVEYPSIFCQNYVDLIDTPGMNDNDEMNGVTLSLLSDIDLAIVAISANIPFSDTECSFMVQLLKSQEINHIIVVVTYIDTVRNRDRERLLSYLRQSICDKVLEKLQTQFPVSDPIFEKYIRIFTQLDVFGVSSLDAMEAQQFGDHDLLEQSGFYVLNQELPRLILSAQNQNALQKGMQAVDRLSRAYEESLPMLAGVCQNQISQLMADKMNFAELGYRGVQIAFAEISRLMKKELDDFSAEQIQIIRQDFVHCLSSIREMNADLLYERLCAQRAASFRKMRLEREQHLEVSLQQCWETQLKTAVDAQEKILDVYGELFQDTKLQLEQLLSDTLQEIHMESRQQIGWLEDPVPKKEELLSCSIISYVLQAAEHSLLVFCENRWHELLDIQNLIYNRVIGRMERIISGLFQRVSAQKGVLENQYKLLTDKAAAERLAVIRRDNAQLQARFLKESGLEEQLQV